MKPIAQRMLDIELYDMMMLLEISFAKLTMINVHNLYLVNVVILETTRKLALIFISRRIIKIIT